MSPGSISRRNCYFRVRTSRPIKRLGKAPGFRHVWQCRHSKLQTRYGTSDPERDCKELSSAHSRMDLHVIVGMKSLES
jgi:hypothetical protein